MKTRSRVPVVTAALSDIGRVRKANEDSYYISESENLLIVCDGMGGQIAGGLASKMAVETIKDVYFGLARGNGSELYSDIDPALPLSARRLIVAVRVANRRIYTQAMRFPRLRGMGTTVVALAFDTAMATMVHVGDSRIFRISDGQILQLTEDHSWLNELIEDNEINEEQIETFSQKNVITRALGTGPTVRVDLHCEKYKKDDAYILCTDGLHNSVTEDDINKLYRQSKGSPQAFAQRLVEKAKKRDGTDNITVAVAKLRQDSEDSTYVGVSATVEEEDERITAKEDKYIHVHFDSKNGKSRKGLMSQQRLMVIGAFVFTSLLFFLLGMVTQSRKRPQVVYRQPALAATGQLQAGVARPAQGSTPTRPPQPAEAQAIQKSPLARDAVLAVVFFNSQADFERARLDQRGAVLDQMHPYQSQSGRSLQGNFSIFVVDSSNNVIRKTTGLELPRFGQ